MRRFTDEDRQRIRGELIRTARALLMRYGPAKTTVEDITEPVGIAKPTFYQFFDSKTELYVIIFEREFDTFMERVESELDGADDPQDRLERLFRCYVEFGEDNEFIQEVFLRGDYREVMGDLSAEQVIQIERKEIEALVPHLEAIQRDSSGPISDMDPITVLGMMGSALGLQVLHKDEYEEYSKDLEELEERIYYDIQDAMITTLARGLTLSVDMDK